MSVLDSLKGSASTAVDPLNLLGQRDQDVFEYTATGMRRSVDPLNLTGRVRDSVDSGSDSSDSDKEVSLPDDYEPAGTTRQPAGAENPFNWTVSDGDIVAPPTEHINKQTGDVGFSMENFIDEDGLNLNPVGDQRLDPTEDSYTPTPDDTDQPAQPDAENEYPLLVNLSLNGELPTIPENDPINQTGPNPPQPQPPQPGPSGGDGASTAMTLVAAAGGGVGLLAVGWFLYTQVL